MQQALGNVVGDRPEPFAAPERAGVLLLRIWNYGEAVMIRQLLDSYGIPCQVISDISQTVLPIAIDGLGEIRILVSRSCLDEAGCLLADHRRQGLRVLRGGKRPRATRRDDARATEGPGGGC